MRELLESESPSDSLEDRRQLMAEAEMPPIFDPRCEGLEDVSWWSSEVMVKKDGK